MIAPVEVFAANQAVRPAFFSQVGVSVLGMGIAFVEGHILLLLLTCDPDRRVTKGSVTNPD
jgi:hypothetical protein